MFEQFGNMMEMVKKLQQNVEDVQSRLSDERIEVASGDVIKIIMNGQQEVISIELNGKYLSSDNTALLQDLLVATVNNALIRSKEVNQLAMNKLAGDLNLPKIPGLF